MKPNIQYHNDAEPPWEQSDGHGPVHFSSKPIVLLDRMIPESDCTSDCEQGRRCTCKEK